ncbi:cell wall metabolism sensor histidine kinase WalK [Streptomyces sp. RP5T]|uniref:sensor histidine kinase n=1 Tax=Streptomyces sp. RP5T TaxID=2490848 RepID=UPI000F6524F9|nr:HAMP domain-containing sensor histidine kinase [Streptomyces sp. RP5T]RRR77390.1 sensor histidine kinase [Streptomyces sp. RP5T]
MGRETAAGPGAEVPGAAVPARRSLLLRLLALAVAVSVCSITATAWVVVRSTAVAIRQEQGQALSEDARTYDALVGYAADHRSWDGVTATVAALSRSTGHRIVLRDGERTLADSAPLPSTPFVPPRDPTAVIDPLAVDPQLLPAGAREGGVDARVVGPYRLSAAERSRLRTTAQQVVECLREHPQVTARAVVGAGGRPVLETSAAAAAANRCGAAVLNATMPSEQRALDALGALVTDCLARRGFAGVTVLLDGSWKPAGAVSRTSAAPAPDKDVRDCVAGSRVEQLRPYVAPVAQLYVSGPADRTASTFLDLSASNKLRIAWGAALVLLVTVTVTALAGVRLVRPLRRLTAAAQRMEAGDVSARVEVTGRDEIARLSAAFNSMSRRREQLETARKAMVSDVAHELRTPLSNIRGWLEAVEDGIVSADEKVVASVLEEALLLQHLVDDLRDLSAAEAGELRLTKAPLTVADVLSQAAEAHRPDARASGVRVLVAADPRCTVVADPVRLRQAVGNLVSNAVRHTAEGGTVRLSAAVEQADSGLAGPERVRIEVCDTGSGIAPEDLPHVFDRFWRAEKSRSRRSGGSGLGLAIVRQLVEAHGGTVEAHSTVGVGSTFVLRFPRESAAS